LAKRSGLSKQAISRLEFGDREPAWSTVQLLAAALGLSCDEFIDHELVAKTVNLEIVVKPAPKRHHPEIVVKPALKRRRAARKRTSLWERESLDK
jgi:transcriptional regulator with XRE-family HTH domain